MLQNARVTAFTVSELQKTGKTEKIISVAYTSNSFIRALYPEYLYHISG